MAPLIRTAIGYGITEKETWTMTPAEISEAVECIAAQRRTDLQIIDIVVAGAKAMYAAAKGVEKAVLDDYRVLKDDDESSGLDMSPEAIQERAFAAMRAGG